MKGHFENLKVITCIKCIQVIETNIFLKSKTF